MIQISGNALRHGCERAHDLFLLNRLRDNDAGTDGLHTVYDALGVDADAREQLAAALLELVPVRGLPVMESTAVSSMMAGVLVGLLIADSALPGEELDLPVVGS